MAGSGSKKTSGISASTDLYGWNVSSNVLSGKSGQSAIYGDPNSYQQIYGSGNNTIYVGGFYSKAEDSVTLKVRIGTKETSVTVSKYTADYVNGGTGSNWISFRSFEFGSGGSKVTGNNYVDIPNEVTPYPSLITGDGTALPIDSTPGVVVNLSTKSLWSALAPLIRTEAGETITNYGLVSGLSDYLSARLITSDALYGLTGSDLFQSGGLGAGEFAFNTNDGTDSYAVGRVVNVQNVQGSNDASNLIVGGASNGILQGGVKADIIVGGTGNSSMYGMGGNDLLVSTVGNDTLYAGQFGHLGPTTPAAAVVTDSVLRSYWNSGSPTLDNLELLANLVSTTFVAGTGIVTMVGSDVGNDYFLVGKANNTVYGSGLGASGLGAEGTNINAADEDTLSFAQIGTLYYRAFTGLTITVTYTDIYQQSGTATASYTTSSGSTATLFNTKFFDIEHFVYGTAMMVFRDSSGNFIYDPIDPGFTGGTPGEFDPTNGLIDTGPSTSTVTGNNPNGGNIVMGGGGGNTDFVGGGNGTTPNTLDFSSNASGTYYECEDTLGETGNVRNFSLVLDLINRQYSYQQDINGTPTVYGGDVTDFQHVIGTVCCSDILVGKEDTFSLTGGGGLHNILYAGGGTFTDEDGTHATALRGSWVPTTVNGGAGYNWVVFQNPLDLLKGGSDNGSGDGQVTYSTGVRANLDPEYTFTNAEGDSYTGDMIGFANILGTAGEDEITGDENDNILVGGNGNDTIAGGGIDQLTLVEHLGGSDILYGGAGDNKLTGLAGNQETFVVGYDYNPVAAGSYSSDGAYGPQLPGESVSLNPDGTIEETIPGGTIKVGVVTTSGRARDNIWGWDTGRSNLDSLYVSTSGTATIRGFDGVDDEDGDFVLDFSNAQNLGDIRVSVGDGDNDIYGSSGVDHIVTGDGDNTIEDTLAIDDWNHASANFPGDGSGTTEIQTINTGSGTDSITVGHGYYDIDAGNGANTVTAGNGNNTILTGHGGDVIVVGNGDNVIRSGDGNDTITAGNGDNLIVAGNGNNTITVGTGINNIYAGAGVNTIDLGVADNNADNVYIYNYTTQNYIENFQTGTDKIYFDLTLLNNLGITSANGALDNSSDPVVSHTQLGDSVLGYGYSNGGYQDYQTGDIGILSGLYDIVYRAVLGTYDSSNGAWSNNEYQGAYVGAVAANSAVIYATMAIAGGLSAIPIVGPLIAIPFYVLGGLMIYDTATTSSYFNAVYNTGGDPLDGFANNLVVQHGPGTSDADWTSSEFLNFYNYSTTGGFKPSLEVVDDQATNLLYPVWDGQIGGIHTIALLYDGTATYIYVVNSADNLIQNNEARLYAKVEGYVAYSDLDIFDAGDDEGPLNFTPGPPPIPPAFVSVDFDPTDANKLAEVDGDSSSLFHTNATSGSLTFLFAGSLEGNTLVLTDSKGIVVDIEGVLSEDGKSVSYAIVDMQAGANIYSLSVTTPAGFSSDTSILLDVAAPPSNTATNTAVQVSASLAGINVSSQVESSFKVLDKDGNPLALSSDKVVADADGYLPSYYEETIDGVTTVYKSVNLALTPQLEQAWIGSFEFKDSLGQTSIISVGPQPRQQLVQKLDAQGEPVLDENDNPVLVPRVDSDGDPVYDSIPHIGLGTVGDDTFDASNPVPPDLSNPANLLIEPVAQGYSEANVVIYGFGGADSVKANETTKFSTTFIAGDDETVSGVDGELGTGDDHLNVITANANGGNLLIDLSGSDDSADTIKIADGAATAHADGSIAMLISGFVSAQDKLQFTDDLTTRSAADGSSYYFNTATDTLTNTTPGSLTDTLTLSVNNGIVSFVGVTESTTLADQIDAVEALLGSTDGLVAAFNYTYITVRDEYNNDQTSTNYGLPTGATITTHESDLVVIHSEGAADYSVVQLVGVVSDADGLSDFVTLTPP